MIFKVLFTVLLIYIVLQENELLIQIKERSHRPHLQPQNLQNQPNPGNLILMRWCLLIPLLYLNGAVAAVGFMPTYSILLHAQK